MQSPTETKNLDIYGSPPIEWERVVPDWGPEVGDGAFQHEFSAPSAGPPPWDVYEIAPTTFYAVATREPHGATRWRV